VVKRKETPKGTIPKRKEGKDYSKSDIKDKAHKEKLHKEKTQKAAAAPVKKGAVKLDDDSVISPPL
jgi:hypothetical protein